MIKYKNDPFVEENDLLGSSEGLRCFGGNQYLHIQAPINTSNELVEADKKLKDMFLLLSLFPTSVRFLFGSLFDREDGSEILPRHVWLSPN